MKLPVWLVVGLGVMASEPVAARWGLTQWFGRLAVAMFLCAVWAFVIGTPWERGDTKVILLVAAALFLVDRLVVWRRRRHLAHR